MTLELQLFSLFILAELFELYWQKAPTLLSMIEKIYTYYKKSPYLLYLMHPSYIFSIFLFYLSSYNLWILLIIIIKSIDIMFKVMLIHKHFVKEELSDELKQMLDAPLNPIVFATGLMFYPYFVYLALF